MCFIWILTLFKSGRLFISTENCHFKYSVILVCYQINDKYYWCSFEMSIERYNMYIFILDSTQKINLESNFSKVLTSDCLLIYPSARTWAQMRTWKIHVYERKNHTRKPRSIQYFIPKASSKWPIFYNEWGEWNAHTHWAWRKKNERTKEKLKKIGIISCIRNARKMKNMLYRRFPDLRRATFLKIAP